MVKIKQKLQNSGSWHSLFAMSVLIAYFLVFMEWLFFVTKPSFMDGMGMSQKAGVLLSTGGILGITTFTLILIFFIVDLLSPSAARGFLGGAALIPAVLLAILALLLLDNFTYTIFKFGIVSSGGVFRAIYALLFLFFLFSFHKWVLNFSGSRRQPAYRRSLTLLPLLLLFASAFLLFGRWNTPASQDETVLAAETGKLPNILILGSDGINASHTSVYGYERDTTPYLDELAARSLLAENAFPNAGNSSGSVTSMLTGKLPTTTRVLYSPNVLNGTDSYQHLPGILKDLGYFTAEIGLPKYVDAYEVNMQDGFDLVNQHFISNDSFFQAGPGLRLGDVSYFLYQIIDRAADRLLHIFYIRVMENPYKLVTNVDTQLDIGDRQRVNQLIELISNTEQPLFAHVHLMGTHGPMFYPNRQVYSAGQEQTAQWADDFYDDAILDFDAYIKEVFDALSSSGKLENTIVVIYTDHNQRYFTTQRIPLLFHFPGGEHAGRIHNNAQNADISPTLLDYLRVPVPEWMQGQSLLRGEPPPNRLIFSATAVQAGPEKDTPPFFQFGTIGVVACDRWYEFYTKSNLLVTGLVEGHTSPCRQEDGTPRDVLRKGLLDHLNASSFDLASLPSDTYEILPYGRVTRAQASLFILKKMHGWSYIPPAAEGLFEDVPPSSPYASWVEQLYQDGLIDTCLDEQTGFCPEDEFTLDDAARLVLRLKNGTGYVPTSVAPSGNGSCASPASPWVEELRAQGILAGCAADERTCCPEEPVDIRSLSGFLSQVLKNP